MPRPCASPSSGSHAKQQYAAATRTEFIRLGTQFIGYRDHAKKVEETLAEANKRADALDLKSQHFCCSLSLRLQITALSLARRLRVRT
ncbi:uncharacterized protein [Lolium perenne]|uniref:uncharacterized protein isoform X3 n=1 Tax=Lolium perenne TaxID=4522 RepID=UPI003A9A5205